MSDMFARFNEMFGDIAKEVEEASSGSVERKEVPFGDYEVKITKLEIAANSFEGEYNGMPELNVWFRIIGDGEYSGQMLFMTKRLVSLKKPSATPFMISKVSDFLNSLESGVPVVFENLEQYANMVATIFNEIDGRAEYQLAYFENKGYKDYQIVKRFQ
jgi:hypothetical protein